MGLILSHPLILASASPRREGLLRLLGLDFQVIPSRTDETFFIKEKPAEHVLRLAENKAHTVAQNHPHAWVLGADTIVVIDGEVLGKPADASAAGRMLEKLSGRTHEVFTGFALMRLAGQVAIKEGVRAAVTFRNISADEKLWYVKSPEPYDKAGAYAVQGLGAFFIKEIQGSYTNVMGLPLCEVVDVLKKTGALRFEV
ncbi:MAG: nucleoside triphosphate pyrophosphatase [Thermodesulfobacteriota bacterium]|nr:nucleoside triphosphate pyrophosphatase [Thermodesulfobacteriota bacterium]